MHPVIRVSLLIALAAGLPTLGLAEIAGLWIALMLFLAVRGRAAFLRAAAMSWRSRWLLIAIALLYVGFTPGEPVWSVLPGLSAEGTLEGLRRAGVILALVSAVVALQETTPLPDLSGAVAVLLTPLRWLRVDTARFALRLGMALDQAGRWRSDLQRQPGLGGWLDTAAQWLQRVEREALEDLPDPVAPGRVGAPPLWQWLLPIALLLGTRQWTG